MTCIAAMVKGEHVWMAGDLMGSNGFTKKVYPDSKVFVNGDFIIGYTSSFRMGQLLQYNWEQPPRLEGMTDREYIQLDVIESMRDCFNTFGYGIKDGLEHSGGNFLLGYRGCIYEMQDNFSILKHDDFAAVGSGQYHAEAALHLLTSNPLIEPAEALQTAIETAAQFTTSVSGECTIVTTDEEAVERMEQEVEEDVLTEEKFDEMSKEDLKKLLFGGSFEEENPELFEGLGVLEDAELVKNTQKSSEQETDVFTFTAVFKDGSTQDYSILSDGQVYDCLHEECFSSFTEDSWSTDSLKCVANALDVRYAHNISDEKLAQRLDDKVKEIVDSLNK